MQHLTHDKCEVQANHRMRQSFCRFVVQFEGEDVVAMQADVQNDKAAALQKAEEA